MADQPSLPLRSGRIPMLGFGTWDLRGDACERAVAAALECGYRHVDTAAGYENHVPVGRGLRAASVPRNEVFLTTKVGPGQLRYDDLLEAAAIALRELQVDVIDLYLVHWPNNDIPMDQTFRAMAKLLDDGVIRNCGVSNFTAKRLTDAVALGLVPISANQVEYHAHLNQRKLHSACEEQGVVLTAYSPLAQGRIAGDARLSAIGSKYGKTATQVALRWLFQRGIPAIPKAASQEHMEANLAVLDWELSPEDFAAVDSLDEWDRCIGWDMSGPDDRAVNG